MQILIGCAKDMNLSPEVAVPEITRPEWLREAEENARQLTMYSADELQEMLGVSHKIAAEVFARYRSFFDSANTPHAAITAYNGVVFRNIGIDEFSDEDFRFAQKHLWITSFLYGLLRPLDGIRPYRLEGKIELPENDGNMFAFWRSRLTDAFIRSIREDDGVLIDLASGEMRQLFNWKEVEKAVKVIKPNFYVEKNGKLRMPSVHAKKCRGAMTTVLLRDRIADPERIARLEGFEPWTV